MRFVNNRQELIKRYFEVNSSRLMAGEKMVLPEYFPHPVYYGFKEWVWPADHVEGKIRDWVSSIPGCGRFHIWELINQKFEIHYDAFDPSKGLMESIQHVWCEAKYGKQIITAVGLSFLALVALGVSE